MRNPFRSRWGLKIVYYPGWTGVEVEYLATIGWKTEYFFWDSAARECRYWNAAKNPGETFYFTVVRLS